MDLAWDVVLGWEHVVLGEGWLLSVGVGGQDTQYQTFPLQEAQTGKVPQIMGGLGLGGGHVLCDENNLCK